jgi:hypothetical protein
MPLVPCAECGYLAQDNAFSCPRCGRRLAPAKKRTPATEKVAAARRTATTPLVVVLVSALFVVLGSQLRWAIVVDDTGARYGLSGTATAGVATMILGACLAVVAIWGLLRRSVSAPITVSIFGLSGTIEVFVVLTMISLIDPSEYLSSAVESQLQFGLWMVALAAAVAFFGGFAVDADRRGLAGATKVTQGWRSLIWVGVGVAVIVIVAIISNQLGAGVAGSLSEVTGELN